MGQHKTSAAADMTLTFEWAGRNFGPVGSFLAATFCLRVFPRAISQISRICNTVHSFDPYLEHMSEQVCPTVNNGKKDEFVPGRSQFPLASFGSNGDDCRRWHASCRVQ